MMQIEKLKEISNEELSKIVKATSEKLREEGCRSVQRNSSGLAKYNVSVKIYLHLQKANLLKRSRPKKKTPKKPESLCKAKISKP